MPIKVPDTLPAVDVLSNENIFVMTETKALHQDIRALRIVLLNLMPLKIKTEIHMMRLLSNNPLQVEVELLHPMTHHSKNTSTDHLDTFYKTFDQIKSRKYDGMIITGAPVEQIEFEEVTYWKELKEIMNWTKNNVTSTLHVCWAAQAGLYHHYGIPKYHLPKKMFGVFKHKVNNMKVPAVRGFDDGFLAPHSRHTEIRGEDIKKVAELEILAESDEAGVYLVGDRIGKDLFVSGHSEYDPLTLKEEYDRDRGKGLSVEVPKNYFPNDDPNRPPEVRWRSHANLLFGNWLNYYVYQMTPFNLEDIH